MTEQRFFEGESIECGGTAMHNEKPSPSFRKWYLQERRPVDWLPTTTFLDYGAGHGRNTEYLRNCGETVWAYDPFNQDSLDGWSGISPMLPDYLFDYAFTCFVLNVVPKHIERKIVEDVAARGKTILHIVRNHDIIQSCEDAIDRKDKTVMRFMKEEYGYDSPKPPNHETIVDFCRFGYQTSRGFQRLTDLSEYGLNLIKTVRGCSVWSSQELVERF